MQGTLCSWSCRPRARPSPSSPVDSDASSTPGSGLSPPPNLGTPSRVIACSGRTSARAVRWAWRRPSCGGSRGCVPTSARPSARASSPWPRRAQAPSASASTLEPALQPRLPCSSATRLPSLAGSSARTPGGSGPHATRASPVSTPSPRPPSGGEPGSTGARSKPRTRCREPPPSACPPVTPSRASSSGRMPFAGCPSAAECASARQRSRMGACWCRGRGAGSCTTGRRSAAGPGRAWWTSRPWWTGTSAPCPPSRRPPREAGASSPRPRTRHSPRSWWSTGVSPAGPWAGSSPPRAGIG